MRVIVRLAALFAAAGFMALPAQALAGAFGDGAWPAGNYGRVANGSDPNDCTKAIQEPVQVAMVGFPSASAAQIALTTQTGWGLGTNDGQVLNMSDTQGGGAGRCIGEAQARVSPVTGTDQRRTYVPLWKNDTSSVLAAAPVRQRQVTCGGSQKWVAAPDGYILGLDSFDRAFQSSLYQGPYPISTVNWGNSASILQCDGTSVSSNGDVAVIRPRDSFGFNDSFDKSRDDVFRAPVPPDQPVDVETGLPPTHPIGDCPQEVSDYYPPVKQSVVDQLSDVGANTARFGLKMTTVAPCSGAPRDEWDWGRWDQTIPQLGDAGIKSLVIAGWPPPRGPGSGGNPDPVWANSCGIPTGDDGLTAWQDFIDDVATRYGDDLKGIEIWNEENFSRYWGGCTPSAASYANVVHYAIQGVQNSSHTDVPIVLGGLFSDPGNDGTPWDIYLGNVMAALTQTDEQALDAIAVHPYRTDDDLDDGIDVTTSAQQMVNDVRVQLANLSVDAPVWVTEVGTTTVQATNPQISTPPYVGTVWDQALADLSIYDTLRNMGVPTVIIHGYVDIKVTEQNPLGPDNAYGVVSLPTESDPALTPKPAYCFLALERATTPGAPCTE